VVLPVQIHRAKFSHHVCTSARESHHAGAGIEHRHDARNGALAGRRGIAITGFRFERAARARIELPPNPL